MSLYNLFRAAIEARITAARSIAYTSLLAEKASFELKAHVAYTSLIAEKASFELKAHAAEELNRNLMIVLAIAVVALAMAVGALLR